MNTNRTFIGYYQVLAGGVRAVFSRQAITVPKTPTDDPINTLYTPVQLDTLLVNILETNELSPVEDLSAAFSDGFFSLLFGILSDQALNAGNKVTAKIGLIIPNSGINKNIPCIEVTTKSAGVKNHFITQITPMVPMAFDNTDWTLNPLAAGNLRVSMGKLPGDTSTLLTPIDEVTLYVYADDTTNISLAQFLLTSLNLNTDNDFVLAPETFTDGVMYYAELVAANADGAGPRSDRKSFVASM